MPAMSHFVDSSWDDCTDDGQSDYSDTSMDTYISEASSRTSVTDVSMRSASPTRSVFSVTSSVRAQAIREEHGRGVNNYSDVYLLPADDEEVDRLSE